MSVASKNLFAILGNDEEPEIPAPVKTVDKSSTHTAKRNTDGVAPSKTPTASGGRRGGVVSGNEAAFRDRNAGRDSNRGKPTDEVRGGRRGGFRGGRGKGDNDRHPHKAAPHGGSEKTAEQAWGSNKGDAELADTEAAQADAKKELTEAEKEAAAQAEAQAALEAEQEKYRTLDQFYAEKDNDDLKAKPIRKVDASAFAGAKPIENKLEDFVAPTTGKKERTRERKQKQFVELENRFIEPERTSGGRGGRGGPRGGRPDGTRGGRGDGAPRRGDGQRGGRGGPRGGAPRGGAPRKENAPINTSDEAAFPSLGA